MWHFSALKQTILGLKFEWVCDGCSCNVALQKKIGKRTLYDKHSVARAVDSNSQHLLLGDVVLSSLPSPCLSSLLTELFSLTWISYPGHKVFVNTIFDVVMTAHISFGCRTAFSSSVKKINRYWHEKLLICNAYYEDARILYTRIIDPASTDIVYSYRMKCLQHQWNCWSSGNRFAFKNCIISSDCP